MKTFLKKYHSSIVRSLVFTGSTSLGQNLDSSEYNGSFRAEENAITTNSQLIHK